LSAFDPLEGRTSTAFSLHRYASYAQPYGETKERNQSQQTVRPSSLLFPPLSFLRSIHFTPSHTHSISRLADSLHSPPCSTAHSFPPSPSSAPSPSRLPSTRPRSRVVGFKMRAIRVNVERRRSSLSFRLVRRR